MDINILPEKRCVGIIKLQSIFDDCFCCKCLNDCCKSPCDCFKCSCSCPCKNAFAFVIFMIITIAVKFYCLLKNKSMLLWGKYIALNVALEKNVDYHLQFSTLNQSLLEIFKEKEHAVPIFIPIRFIFLKMLLLN